MLQASFFFFFFFCCSNRSVTHCVLRHGGTVDVRWEKAAAWNLCRYRSDLRRSVRYDRKIVRKCDVLDVCFFFFVVAPNKYHLGLRQSVFFPHAAECVKVATPALDVLFAVPPVGGGGEEAHSPPAHTLPSARTLLE